MDIESFTKSIDQDEELLVDLLDLIGDYSFNESLYGVDNETYSHITIQNGFNAKSIKFSNLILNQSSLLDDFASSGLALNSGLPLVKKCVEFFPYFGLHLGVAISMILYHFIKSKVVKKLEINLSKKHGVILYLIWKLSEGDSSGVEVEELHLAIQDFVEKNSLSEIDVAESTEILRNLESLRCINLSNGTINLLEKVTLEVNFN